MRVRRRDRSSGRALAVSGRRGGRWLPIAARPAVAARHARRRRPRTRSRRRRPPARRARSRRRSAEDDRAAAAAAAPLLPRAARPGWTRRSPRCSTGRPSSSTTATTPGALACAEEAARQAPRSVEAHHNRAIALMRLDRLDEARDALALALALAPDDPETLEAAADLNINQLPPSVDRSALGLEYARRGSRHVGRRDRERIARLALLEGQALIDLGRAVEALRRIDARAEGVAAASRRPSTNAASRCSSCAASRRRGDTFEKVLAATPDHAHALYHLGLDRGAAGRRRGGRRATSRRRARPTPSRSRCRWR